MEDRDEIIHMAMSNLQILLAKEKQAGINEVVDYLAQNYSKELYSSGLFQVVITSEEWQAKLKELGIKKVEGG